jgi:hypothetical protein
MAAAGEFNKVLGDLIYRLDYNSVQTLVESVKTGFYGAACVSSQLPNPSTVTAAQWNNLKTDIDYCIAIQSAESPITTKVVGTLIVSTDINLYKAQADQINANKRGFYSVSPNVTSVNEGGSVVFTVTTLYVPNGTVLYWSTSGTATAGDFTDGVTQGTLTINSGSGSVTRTLSNDSSTEGTESFTFSVFLDSGRTDLGATSGSITVNDTSQTPPPPPPPDSSCGDSGCGDSDSGCTDSDGMGCSDAAGDGGACGGCACADSGGCVG